MLATSGFVCSPNNYNFTVENVQEFVAFLRDCGGFEIW